MLGRFIHGNRVRCGTGLRRVSSIHPLDIIALFVQCGLATSRHMFVIHALRLYVATSTSKLDQFHRHLDLLRRAIEPKMLAQVLCIGFRAYKLVSVRMTTMHHSCACL